ncbi:hypothetical protein CJD36_019790 [Flavipsychrobacter stenotrophus]|uniref:Uncharacterized protein n=1 Tax=Flavipsychrobacter stenotrophus TaxID=2077091 RepID=A0A2S7SRW1_9BACT|nr:hypothetical protein CJD36_019790 [Flavipsychrobacter stenotrophus]
MLDIKWQRNGPTEDKAEHDGMVLKRRFVAGKHCYYIYIDDVLMYNTSIQMLFMQRVAKPALIFNPAG